MRVPGIGGPRQVLAAALAAMETEGLALEVASPIIATAPLGPSRRNYANAAAVVSGEVEPPVLLALLQRIEGVFGRRQRGQRWRSRPLDLDIVLWSGGAWLDQTLAIPHPRFRSRTFMLGPAAAIMPQWRDPASGLTLRHLHARLTRPHRVPSCPSWSGP